MIGLLFVISILVLSQAATLIRFAEASSLAICFWRLLIAALILLPAVLTNRRYREYLALTRGEAVQLFLSGLFLFAHFYFFFRSAHETTIAECTILYCLNPVTTAIGAWFLFRERMGPRLVTACAFGFAGVIATFAGTLDQSTTLQGVSTFRGDVWGALSAVFFSGYILTGKRVRLKISNVPYAAAVYLQTALYASVMMAVFSVPFTGYTSQTWIAFVALAIVPTLMGHAIFTYLLNYINVNVMSIMTLSEPVLAGIAGWFLFHETVSNLAVLGFVLTVISVLIIYVKPFARPAT